MNIHDDDAVITDLGRYIQYDSFGDAGWCDRSLNNRAGTRIDLRCRCEENVLSANANDRRLVIQSRDRGARQDIDIPLRRQCTDDRVHFPGGKSDLEAASRGERLLEFESLAGQSGPVHAELRCIVEPDFDHFRFDHNLAVNRVLDRFEKETDLIQVARIVRHKNDSGHPVENNLSVGRFQLSQRRFDIVQKIRGFRSRDGCGRPPATTSGSEGRTAGKPRRPHGSACYAGTGNTGIAGCGRACSRGACPASQRGDVVELEAARLQLNSFDAQHAVFNPVLQATRGQNRFERLQECDALQIHCDCAVDVRRDHQIQARVLRQCVQYWNEWSITKIHVESRIQSLRLRPLLQLRCGKLRLLRVGDYRILPADDDDPGVSDSRILELADLQVLWKFLLRS